MGALHKVSPRHTTQWSTMEAEDESEEEWGDSGCNWEVTSDWSDDLDDEDSESEQHSSDLIDVEEVNDEELGNVDGGDDGECGM